MKNRNYMTRLHLLLEILAWAMWLASLILAIIGMLTVEGQVPIHFNGRGEVDGYGSPSSLLIMPVIMFATLGITSVMLHLVDPSSWNMPFKVHPLRRTVVYRDMITMVVVLEVLIAGYCLCITVASVQQRSLGLLSTVVFIGGLTLDIILCWVIAARHNKM